MAGREELSNDALREIVERALLEDAPAGDLTTELTIPPEARCSAELHAKQNGVLAGRRVAQCVFDVVGSQDRHPLEVAWRSQDGDRVRSGDVVAVIEGNARSVLRAERIAINFLSHLSGVATLTRRFVDEAGPAVRLLNTRKTLPGLRAVEREAVAAGGGTLHRASLSDAVLLKDNHLRIAGSLTDAIARAKAGGVPVE